MNNLKRFFLFLGFIIIVGLVYYIGPSNIFSKAKTARWDYLLLGSGMFILSMVIRSIKWNLGLKVFNIDSGFYKMFWVYCFSGMVCYFTPWKTGDIIAPFLFKKHFDHSVGGGLSIVLVDRLFEFFALVILILISTIAMSFRLANVSDFISGIMKAIVFLLSGIIVFMGLVLTLQVRTRKALSVLYYFFSHPKIKELINRAIQTLNNFYKSIDQLKNKPFISKIAFYTCLALVIDYLFFYFVINSTITIGFMDCFIILFLTIGFSLVSFMPTGMGALEISAVYLFSLLNYHQIPIASSMILMRVISMGVTIILGVVGMGVMKGWSKKYNKVSS